MKNKVFIILFLIHFGLSLVGFLGLSAWALAVQDAGPAGLAAVAPEASAALAPQAEVAVAALGWLEGLLRFGLLQPIAHWVLAGTVIAWWTWPGLAALTALIAVNSLVAAGFAYLCLRLVLVRVSGRRSEEV